MDPRSVLDRVCFLRARSVGAFSVDSYKLLYVKTHEFFFGGAWGMYIRSSNIPAKWDHWYTT